MKKILKPSEHEEAVYYSDFQGIVFDECGPDVEVKIDFNYGSKYDGARMRLHLTDKEFEPLLNLIKEKGSEDFKKELQKQLDLQEDNYEDSMQMRDWDSCDRICGNLHLYRDLLDKKED